MEEKILKILAGKSYNILEFKKILIQFYKDNLIEIPSHYSMYLIWDEYCTKKTISKL